MGLRAALGGLGCAGAVLLVCVACSDDFDPEDGGDDTDAGGGADAGAGAALDADLASEALARSPVTELCEASASGQGLVDDDAFRERSLEYLRMSTQETRANPWNLVAHLLRERLDAGYSAPVDAVAADAWDGIFEHVDTLKDVSDFRVLDLLGLLYEADGHPIVSDALYQRVEETLLDFKYWFTDTTLDGKRDDMWYWTENHLIGFHAAEYLAGQRFPDATFWPPSPST